LNTAKRGVLAASSGPTSAHASHLAALPTKQRYLTEGTLLCGEGPAHCIPLPLAFPVFHSSLFEKRDGFLNIILINSVHPQLNFHLFVATSVAQI
jgi:hypothetical protein